MNLLSPPNNTPNKLIYLIDQATGERHVYRAKHWVLMGQWMTTFPKKHSITQSLCWNPPLLANHRRNCRIGLIRAKWDFLSGKKDTRSSLMVFNPL